MKAKLKLLATLVVCMSMCFIISCSPDQGTATDSKGRPEVSPGERALASIEVQNVFSKHCYYHEAGLHRAEMEDIWVKRDGEFAETAKWKQPMGINRGYEAIWQFYVINKEKSNQQILDQLSEIYPEIENKPENLGIGGEWASHVQTTPIIEIAGDGETAKGVWESPGLLMAAQIRDGKVNKKGGWFWEKYAVDFVKEDGEWKIWHIAMYYENTPPGWNADTNSYESRGGEEGFGGPPGPGGPGAPVVGKVAEELAPQTQVGMMYSDTNPNPYKPWSPTKLPRIEPRFPEPYYTFSETFSY